MEKIAKRTYFTEHRDWESTSIVENVADLSLTNQEISVDANAGLTFLIRCRCKITVQSTLNPQLECGLIVSKSVNQ